MSNGEFYIIDTYAWIEYFAKTKKGFLAKSYIESGASILPTIVLAELKNSLLKQVDEGRETLKGAKARLDFAKTMAKVAVLDSAIAERAAEVNIEKRKVIKDWPLADSILLATAEAENAKLVSGDAHFKGERNVIFLE